MLIKSFIILDLLHVPPPRFLERHDLTESNIKLAASSMCKTMAQEQSRSPDTDTLVSHSDVNH